MNDIGSSIMGLLSTNHRSNDAMFAMYRSSLFGGNDFEQMPSS